MKLTNSRAGRVHRFVLPAMLCIAATAAFAHQDDPKERNPLPAYAGPGYRSGMDGPEAPVVFSSQGVELLSWIPLGEFPGTHDRGNDCWGYVSPSGREYAIMGLQRGTGFVEITDPGMPVIIDVIAGETSTWRDIKVFQHYAYAVTEASGGGIQVIDMSQIDSGTVTLVTTITGNGTSSTHNVALNEESGFLYRAGGGSNGLRIYSLADPANPTFVAEWNDRYVHDAQVVTYTDGPWAGREIAFCCSGFNGGWVETGLDILDVTDKQNIIQLDRYIYPNNEYSHQAWLSEDRQYLYLNDELDENGVLPTTTFVINVSDLENAFTETTFTNGNTAIGHNLYVRGSLIFEANYRSGLRVFDASADPLNPVEVAFFDTFPDDDDPNYNGLWSNYPYFPSGTIIGSDMERGLFVWRLMQPAIPGDVNGDGMVDVLDLLELLADWGECPLPPNGCPADVNGDGTVDVVDLLSLLANWT
jgi:choice-of-anchor B domain-containing protein